MRNIDKLPAVDAIDTGGGQDAAGQQQDLSMRILGNNQPSGNQLQNHSHATITKRNIEFATREH